jgi:hypothetical protein
LQLRKRMKRKERSRAVSLSIKNAAYLLYLGGP